MIGYRLQLSFNRGQKTLCLPSFNAETSTLNIKKRKERKRKKYQIENDRKKKRNFREIERNIK